MNQPTHTPIFIAGPCVIESAECLAEVPEELVRLNHKELLPFAIGVGKSCTFAS